MTWRIDRYQAEGWNHYDVVADGLPVATAKWRVHGDDAELHSEIVGPPLSGVRAAIKHFRFVRADMRSVGVKRVVVMSDRYDEKMGRYWKRLGFEFFTKQHGVDCAVMEA